MAEPDFWITTTYAWCEMRNRYKWSRFIYLGPAWVRLARLLGAW